MKKWKKILLDNWVLKLISLTIAFALWFVVIIIDDPVDDKTFNNIKVNLVNTDLLTDKNMVYEVLDGTDVLRSVSFEAPRSIREKIEAGDIIAEADLNDLTVTNTVAIKFSCPKYSNDVSNISGNISYVKLNIEEKDSKWINIDYNLVGEVTEGYMINSISLDQNRLEIEGPASKIAEISKAVVDINVAGIYNDISTRVDIHLKNADGAELNYATVSKNADNVKATVDVLAMKEVPVEYLTMGEPAEGYAATGIVDATPQTVVIAGNTSTLSNVSKIVVSAEAIDITGAEDNFEQVVNLRQYLPSGIIFADKEFDGRAYITVYVEELIDRELNVTGNNFDIVNVPDGLVAEISQDVEIPELRIRGFSEHVSLVREYSLTGVVDVTAWMESQEMEELTPGTYQIPITFELSENVEQVEPVEVTLEFITAEEMASRSLTSRPTNE